MSVLSFVEVAEGKIKKASWEAAYYASQVATKLGVVAEAVVLGEADTAELSSLGAYGITKVHHVADVRLNVFDSKAFTKAVCAVAESTGARAIVLSFNQNGKLLGPRISVRLKAGLVPGASELPAVVGDWQVRKNVFSGKATATYKVNTPVAVFSVNPNSVTPVKGSGTAEVVSAAVSLSDADFSIRIVRTDKVKGTVPLTEAERVISGGRGLKGPENWGMIEELANELGAATACSRAVSDVDWRPHHEHVGQTGLTIRPNLYIAAGISGAIQHLAGVNGSKVIVVVNTDPEAPFFKAADYGVVGDAFEVIPKLTEEIRKLRANG
jgi:electron transfer flavoprotein alpha subunit